MAPTKAQKRLIEIIAKVSQRPRQYTARQLAEEFGVSVRTIRRDIQTLDASGISIRSMEGGGYYLVTEYPVVVGLSDEERLALHLMPLCLDLSAQTDALPMVERFRSAIDKLVRRADDAEKWDHIAHRIVPEPPFGKPAVPDVISILLQAMVSQRTVTMVYRNFSRDEVTHRLVDPYQLIPRQNSLYVFGYCHLREDYRIFKVSRIQHIALTSKAFVVEDDVDLEAELRTAWSIDMSGPLVSAELAVSPQVRRYVEEELAHRPGIEAWDGPDGRWYVRMQSRINPEFLRWVMQFGPEVEVVGPPSLREVVAQRARAMMDVYARG